MNKLIKRIVSSPFVNSDEVITPARCLGSRLRDQMFSGVSSENSTLLTGMYDDEDNWDVDPLCDMSSDRLDLSLVESVPVVEPVPVVQTPLVD